MWPALLSNSRWEFPPLIGLRDKGMDINTMITTYNTAVIDAAREIPGKEHRRKNNVGHQRRSRPLR